MFDVQSYEIVCQCDLYVFSANVIITLNIKNYLGTIFYIKQFL